MLLIFDEAQTAFGRLGHWFAATHLQVTPDIMTVSKTLGGGMPLAAVITNDEIEDVCHRRGFAFYTSHVSDPLPSAVGLAVLETIESEHLLQRSRDMGDYLADGLRELQSRHEEIGDVRGMGLLRGIELVARSRDARATSRARCADHAAMPGTGPQHEHPPAARARVGVAHRAAADGDQGGHRSRDDDLRSGAGRDEGRAGRGGR